MIKHRVALVGPSFEEEWSEDRYEGEPSVVWFARDAKRGDLVVLRQGVRKALAVGVLGGYKFEEDLLDIEGWDMAHARPVRWLTETEKEFDGRPLSRTRFSRCNVPTVRRWVESQIRGRDLKPPTWKVKVPGLGGPLDTSSLTPGIKRVIREAGRFHQSYWHEDFGPKPSEAELLAHITVPLLGALGWKPQHVALEWMKTDMALFSALPRRPENCVALIEGKRLGAGLHPAGDQVQRYAQRVGHHVLTVVTDGTRYRVVDSRNPETEIAYANLVSPRESANHLFKVLQRDAVCR